MGIFLLGGLLSHQDAGVLRQEPLEELAAGGGEDTDGTNDHADRLGEAHGSTGSHVCNLSGHLLGRNFLESSRAEQ